MDSTLLKNYYNHDLVLNKTYDKKLSTVAHGNNNGVR